MFFKGPSPFLLGVAKLALQGGRQDWIASIPNGGWWTLKFLLVDYPRAVADGVQTSPDLSYRLFDADGRAFMVRPVSLPMVTSPAGAFGLNATNLINIRYPGGSSVRLELSGRIPAKGPATASITLYGIRAEQRLGG